MIYSKHNEADELNNAILVLKDKLSKYMNQLTAGGNQLARDAYKAYLVETTKMNPDQIISEACDQLQFLISSAALYDDLTQYIIAKKSYDPSVKSICILVKELTGEELLPSDLFDSNKMELNTISARLAQKGITPTWLVSHGLASEQETAKFQQSTNITGITYKKVKNGIRIDSVSAGGGIVIPEFIDGLPVVKIADKAFYKRKDISSIILPRYLNEIGEEAFSESSIVSMVVPDSVESIGKYAFNNCRKLESIILPERLKTIKYSTFGGCSALTAIRIPTNVASIGDKAFDRCGKLKRVQIPDSVTRFGYWVFSSKPTIYCSKDSRASRYVSENYMPQHKPYDMYDKEK